MMRLILMRHAKSDWSHPGVSDHERPLNKRGKASALALGDWLRGKGCIPDEVLSSSAERTGETLFALNLVHSTKTQFTRDLYLATAQVMMNTLRGAESPTVLMLGHNPGICELAHRLIDDPPDNERFSDYPTGATLICDFEAQTWSDIDWHEGTVVDFVVPRELLV